MVVFTKAGIKELIKMTDTLLVILLVVFIHFLMVLFSFLKIRRSGHSDRMKFLWAVYVTACPLLGFIAYLMLGGNPAEKESND